MPPDSMPPDDVDFHGPPALGLHDERRCTARCVTACVRAALRAGEEGSGLALTIPGAERHCHLHLAVAHGDHFRRVRVAIWYTLQAIRRTRAAVSRAVGYAFQIIGRRRSAAYLSAARVGAQLRDGARGRRQRHMLARQEAAAGPRCTPRCLARCARAGLSAGVEGSGLALSVDGYCRFHRTLLDPKRTVVRQGIGLTLRGVRSVRIWQDYQRVRVRAHAARLMALRSRLHARTLWIRQEWDAVRSRDGVLVAAATLIARLTSRVVARVRARATRPVAVLLGLWRGAQLRAWWPPLQARARVQAESWVRSVAAAITELLVRVVRPPRPPVRSVCHVSLISHKQFMLSRLARTHGLKGTFLAINTYPGAHLKIGFDYEVPMKMDPFRRYLRATWYLWRVLAFHDVIHYHFNGFLFDDGTDLRVLQRMGKVIVVHYRGCDLRCRSINMAKNPELNVCQECSYPPGSCDTDYQRNKIAISRTYSDVRFVTTPDLLDFTDDAEHLPFIAPYGLDFSTITPAPRTPGVFRVVTSSNHPALDGVRFVRDAVARLASEGVKIELIEIHRQPFHEALALYKSADLYCGKLRMGYYNNANIESLMLGVPNMCYIREQYLDRIPDSPIIVARPDNVYEKLREWVDKPDELKRLGALGPEFVRRHHEADALMRRMIARYNDALQQKVAARARGAVASTAVH